MSTRILLSTLVVPILFLPMEGPTTRSTAGGGGVAHSTARVAAFKFRFLKGDCCGSMPLMDAVDPGGPIARFVSSPEVQSCLDQGWNIGLVRTKKGSAPYCWEPEPAVNLDPRAIVKRAAPIDTRDVRSAIACWNRNGSITRKSQRLSCIDTPEALRREVEQVAIKEEGVP